MIQSARSTSPLQSTPHKGNVRLDDFDPLLELQSLRRKWESQSSLFLGSTPSEPAPKREPAAIIAAAITVPANTPPYRSLPNETVIPVVADTANTVDTADTVAVVRTQSDTKSVHARPSSYVAAELSGWFFMAIGMCIAMVGSLFFLRYSLFPESPRWEMDLPLALLGSFICSLGLCIHQWRLHQMVVQMSVCAGRVNNEN